VRLVVPGFYGTNSVKWLTRMTLAATRIENPFATRWFNDEVLDSAGRPTGRSRPLWQLPPQSIIVAPAPQTRVRCHQPVTVWGWTWADVGTESVLIANEDGTLHLPALVEPRRDRAWQKFEATWMPNCAGIVNLTARATDRNGDTQGTATKQHEIK
jgi:sulfane dehydrogenase subunit SoxC